MMNIVVSNILIYTVFERCTYKTSLIPPSNGPLHIMYRQPESTLENLIVNLPIECLPAITTGIPATVPSAPPIMVANSLHG